MGFQIQMNQHNSINEQEKMTVICTLIKSSHLLYIIFDICNQLSVMNSCEKIN